MRNNKFQRKGGRQAQSEKYDLHCTHYNRDWHDASTCKMPWDRIEQQRNQEKGKTQVKFSCEINQPMSK